MSTVTLQAIHQLVEALSTHMTELPTKRIVVGWDAPKQKVEIYVVEAAGNWLTRKALVNQLADLLAIETSQRAARTDEFYGIQIYEAQNYIYVIYAIQTPNSIVRETQATK